VDGLVHRQIPARRFSKGVDHKTYANVRQLIEGPGHDSLSRLSHTKPSYLNQLTKFLKNSQSDRTHAREMHVATNGPKGEKQSSDVRPVLVHLVFCLLSLFEEKLSIDLYRPVLGICWKSRRKQLPGSQIRKLAATSSSQKNEQARKDIQNYVRRDLLHVLLTTTTAPVRK
jgi:hypothetical protein